MIHLGNNYSHNTNCQIKSGLIQQRRERNNQQSISKQHCNNKFDLLNNEVECYMCHNFGHKSIDCRLRNYEPDSKSPVENVKFSLMHLGQILMARSMQLPLSIVGRPKNLGPPQTSFHMMSFFRRPSFRPYCDV
jgi:hypothetical protein